MKLSCTVLGRISDNDDDDVNFSTVMKCHREQSKILIYFLYFLYVAIGTAVVCMVDICVYLM